jgi:hypothetical protein
MTKFIWVRDIDKKEHYINVDTITRVTKSPELGLYKAYSYIVIADGTPGGKCINLSNDTFDTADDVIAKIQIASA